MRVAIRVDAGPLIGGGHAIRCLTLADALAEKGAEVTFITAAMPDSLETRIAAAEHRMVRIPASPELQREGSDWHKPPLSETAQLDDAAATEAVSGAVDWMIVDHYLLDARWHSAARRFASRVLAIDDLANRPYDCDILVDQTFGRSGADYEGLVSAHSEIMAGATYAILRPEFARQRPAALERRGEQAVRRILISIGTTDPGGITATILGEALAAARGPAIDVVLGPDAESLAHVEELARQHSGITLHVNSDHMAQLIRDADLAIGASGMSALERCCLGLPSVILCLADNQRPNALALADAGAAVAIESPAEIRTRVAELCGDAEARAIMARAASRVTDGLGTQRIVSCCMSVDQAARRAG